VTRQTRAKTQRTIRQPESQGTTQRADPDSRIMNDDIAGSFEQCYIHL